MADFNTPATSQNYATGYTASILENFRNLARMLDSGSVTVTNPPTGAKRYNAANQLFERRNAGNTAWEEMPLAYAKIGSPTFTGTPAAPTAAADTNTTQLATTAFVVGQAGGSNPAMNGTAAAGASLRYSRQDHVHPTDTSRAPLASPNFSGTPQVSGNNIWHAGNFNPANYQTVSGMSAYAALASAPTFTGLVYARGGGAGLGQITVSTSEPSGGADGDLWLQY